MRCVEELRKKLKKLQLRVHTAESTIEETNKEIDIIQQQLRLADGGKKTQLEIIEAFEKQLIEGYWK